MGFFDWLMKGVGFEADEDQVKPEKKKKKKDKKREAEEAAQEQQEQAELETRSFDGSAYNAFGSVDANNFSSNETNPIGDFAPENGVGGYGTKNVVIYRPKTLKEVQGLIDYLKQGESAIMILDGLQTAEAQRVLDFVGGAVYALSGSIKKIEGNIFLMTPEGYNIVS